jgi:hypothetical protein
MHEVEVNVCSNSNLPQCTTSTTSDVIVKCANCNRRPIENCASDYKLNLREVSSSVIIGRRNFAFLNRTQSSDPIDYLICEQCSLHLTEKDADKGNASKVIWPGFHWSILRSAEIHKKYNSSFIWRIVPLVWRSWWYEEIKEQFPTEPASLFIDRTGDLKTWNDAIE